MGIGAFGALAGLGKSLQDTSLLAMKERVAEKQKAAEQRMWKERHQAEATDTRSLEEYKQGEATKRTKIAAGVKDIKTAEAQLESAFRYLSKAQERLNNAKMNFGADSPEAKSAQAEVDRIAKRIHILQQKANGGKSAGTGSILKRVFEDHEASTGGSTGGSTGSETTTGASRDHSKLPTPAPDPTISGETDVNSLIQRGLGAEDRMKYNFAVYKDLIRTHTPDDPAVQRAAEAMNESRRDFVAVRQELDRRGIDKGVLQSPPGGRV